MKIALSQKERAAFVAIVGGEPSWGGDEASLLTRDEMYAALDLERFEGRKILLDQCSDKPVDYEVSPEVAQHMIATLCGARLVAALGRVAARVVRRLRAALEGKTDAPPAPVLKLEPPACAEEPEPAG